MTFLKKLRDAAAGCSNVEYRDALRRHADNVSYWIAKLNLDPTEFNMQALNCAWAAADRFFNNIPPEGSPDPVSGSPEPAVLAIAA